MTKKLVVFDCCGVWVYFTVEYERESELAAFIAHVTKFMGMTFAWSEDPK